MTDIAELERRILYALERIGSQLERAPQAGGGSADAAALQAELEAEKATNAQLTERVRAIKDKQETVVQALERKVAALAEQVDQFGVELERQRRLNAELTAVNRDLTAAGGAVDGEMIHAALRAEVEAMRAERALEIAEMSGILAELRPLIGEVA